MTVAMKEKGNEKEQVQADAAIVQGESAEKELPKRIVLLHWLLAASVFFLFVSSWWMLSLPLPSDNFSYREVPFQLHKNVGITLFAALLVMAVMRVRILLQESQRERTWLKRLAVWDHLLLYFVLAVCCLSGYASSSYSGWATTLWWLIDLPLWSAENDELNIFFSDMHMISCWALLALLLLHIGAAIYHSVAGDGTIEKMFRLRD